MEFNEFDLDPRCLRVLEKQGIKEPTPIQEQTIRLVLEGKDVVGLAQTGTGKTLAYTLPTLTRIAQGKVEKNQVLILSPTRELTNQVQQVVRDIGKAMRVRSVCIYGGAPMGKQTDELKKGCAVIVATPGRLLDHMSRGHINFGKLDTLILDEADRMLDMGFLPDIQRILSKLPKERQTLMFSATFPDDLKKLTRTMMNEPEWIQVGQVHKPVDKVDQTLYTVKPEDKYRLLEKVLEENHIHSALIFARTRNRTDQVHRFLKRKGYKATGIHGDHSQGLRERSLKGFKDGKHTILVATDVAARGLDVDHISHVINFDVPQTSDDYLHRIGRTARANAEGNAMTFVTPAEYDSLANIERALGRNLPRQEWDGATSVLSLFKEGNRKQGAKRSARRGSRRRAPLHRR